MIALFMQGALTRHYAFDSHPDLARRAGRHSEMDLAIGTQRGKILAPVFDFVLSLEGGRPISEVSPIRASTRTRRAC